jgi:hypothetical protein
MRGSGAPWFHNLSSPNRSASVAHFLPAGNSNVKTKISCLKTANSSLPRRCLAAIVLAYLVESSVWAKARSGRNQVMVQGAEWEAVLDAAQNARPLLLIGTGDSDFRRSDHVDEGTTTSAKSVLSELLTQGPKKEILKVKVDPNG